MGQTTDSTTLIKSRLYPVIATHVAANAAMLYVLNDFWYKNYEHSGFHFKDDMGEWNQVDKLGHAYSAYAITGILSNVYHWTGVSKGKSIAIGAVGSMATMSIIEMLDAYSAEWGFSYGDMLANVGGIGLYATQELLLKKQVVQLKYGFQYKKYPQEFNERVKDVYGDNIAERMVKDYNGQSYWLSVDVSTFYNKWPAWLNVALGYGAEDMYGAFYNTWKDRKGKYHDYSHIHRYRQWLLSFDVNFANINTRYKFLNSVLDVLYIKVPAPALELNSKGKLKFHPIFF